MLWLIGYCCAVFAAPILKPWWPLLMLARAKLYNSLTCYWYGFDVRSHDGSSPLESVPELATALPRFVRGVPAWSTSAGLLDDAAQGLTGRAARITVALDDAALPASWAAGTLSNPVSKPNSRPTPRGAYWAGYQLPGRRGLVTTGEVSAEPGVGSDGASIRVVLRHADEHWVSLT